MLIDKFLMFPFQKTLKMANITGYPDLIIIKLDGFDQVIFYVHH